MFAITIFKLTMKTGEQGVDTVKVVQMLLENGSISKDYVLTVDEMSLQKSIQYRIGGFIGPDAERSECKGVVVFLTVSLKDFVQTR